MSGALQSVHTRPSVAVAAAVALIAVSSLAPSIAVAADKEHFYAVDKAVASKHAPEGLMEIPFYMKGAAHPEGMKKVGDVTSTWTTRGAFRTNESACQVAFLSAMQELQKQVRAKGADALIDVVSITESEETASPIVYRCMAGMTVVNVGLKGTIVRDTTKSKARGDSSKPGGAASLPR